MATRDLLRSQLTRLSEALDDSAQRRHKVQRTEQRRPARRQAERADAPAFDEPADDLAADSDLEGPPGLDCPQPKKERRRSAFQPGDLGDAPRRSRPAARTQLAWGA